MVGSDVDKCGQGGVGSDCMRTSTTLLGTKASRAGIQQCLAILITTTVTVLTVLNRPLWSLNLSDLGVTCRRESATSHPDYMMYVDADIHIGRRRGVSQMRTKADKGRGGLKIAKFSGRPLWTTP